MSKKEEKKEETEDFNLTEALENLERPAMFKAGLEYYITTYNPKINNQKEFDKVVKDYGELKLGG